MKMKKSYKDTDLREALRRKYSDTPQLPADFMEKMQERLTQQDEAPSPKSATQKRLWRWVAAAACLLILIGVGITMLPKDQSEQAKGIYTQTKSTQIEEYQSTKEEQIVDSEQTNNEQENTQNPTENIASPATSKNIKSVVAEASLSTETVPSVDAATPEEIVTPIETTTPMMIPATNYITTDVGIFVSLPDVKTDNHTKKTAATWHQTNMEWIKDYCEPQNFTIEKDFQKLFPEIADVSLDEQSYMPMAWRLTGENGETVLHCYLRMPTDEVTNMWLTGEEACLLDPETGVQYRVRRTEPDTYRKHFDVNAKKGDIIDMKVIFPPLPETTTDITIYGVPNWGLMGVTTPIRYRLEGTVTYYDTIPQFHLPRLVLEHMGENKPYDRQNWNTWKVLDDAHLIKPLQDGTMALWRTPEATYVAVGYEQNWTTEYFFFDKDMMLVDELGHQYKLRETLGIPKDELFFIKGNSGDYIAFLLVFDPLPLSVSTVTFIVPDGEPFDAWGANWSGSVTPNISIQQLHENQQLFEYHPRVVVE